MIKRGHDVESAPSIGMSAPISSCEFPERIVATDVVQLLRFVCGARKQKGNYFGSVLRRCEPTKRLHIISRYKLLGAGYEAI
jgi:hypothetical protein